MPSTTGEGKSPGFLPFAFERFRQQDSTAPAPVWVCLSMWYATLIEHHGGSVSAESPGAGQCCFPRRHHRGADVNPAGSGERQSEDRLPAGLKVLLVDDEEDAREAPRPILQTRTLRSHIPKPMDHLLPSSRRWPERGGVGAEMRTGSRPPPDARADQ
jgi:hypothetical protein